MSNTLGFKPSILCSHTHMHSHHKCLAGKLAEPKSSSSSSLWQIFSAPLPRLGEATRTFRTGLCFYHSVLKAGIRNTSAMAEADHVFDPRRDVVNAGEDRRQSYVFAVPLQCQHALQLPAIVFADAHQRSSTILLA